MAYKSYILIALVITVFVFAQLAESQPISQNLQRQKRNSDQRLAELETLLGLHRMKNKLVTVPVGFGRVDPAKLGRRRRSVQKLLRTLIQDSSSQSEEDQRFSEEVAEEEEERLRGEDSSLLLLNLLYNEELRNRYRALPVRLPE